MSEVCKFLINTKFVKNQLKNIFTKDTLHLSLISIKMSGALCRTDFQKHELFTTGLPAFTVGEMCNISNKYWPNKLEKYLKN